MERGPVLFADAAVPVAVAAIVLAGIAFSANADVGSLALGLAAAAVLTARRRAPAVTLALSGGLAVVLFHLDRSAGAAAVFAPAVALYSLALTGGRVRQLVAGLVAVAVVVVAETVFVHRPAGIHQTLAHVALVAVPLLAAEALRNRRSYVALLHERLEVAERTREEEAERRVEQERLRIARDLHDVVAHTLTTINVQASVAAHLLDRDPGHARAALATITDASHDALDELRAVVGVLRERDDRTVPREPAPTLDGVAMLVERTRAGGQPVSLDITGQRPARLSDAVELAAFRIVQESLTNIARHARGAPAHVGVAYKQDRLLVTIKNPATPVGNGTGGVGVGIIGMKERAATVGGTLDAARSRDGFLVAAELPYRRTG